MNRLFEIAKNLDIISTKRFYLRESIRKFETSIKRAETELIPEGGWPGSNETQRKAAEATAKLNDPNLAYLRGELEADQHTLDVLDVERQGLIDERDAWQWTIRDEDNVARGQESVFVQMMRYEPEELDCREVNAEYEKTMSQMREEAAAPVATNKDGVELPF